MRLKWQVRKEAAVADLIQSEELAVSYRVQRGPSHSVLDWNYDPKSLALLPIAGKLLLTPL